ncbi:uncharacterized protein TNIN_228471 [Trichonephila inaurata madagascariensis]|uniref:Uncharacterized protein n=1 Tax=Trichonephila inaurata madagascariensis TaxID=2747483 RepID=A0A8X7CFI1_9ARAC|nr:uncharacterized protein TNIN_228471 [Trichonephila inaurata madagascariensis]
MQHETRKKEFNPVPQKENSVDSATAASLVSLKSSDSGLTVIKTKLENTVIGMHNEVVHIDGNVMTTLTMHVGNIKLADLWELQHLGILDPTLKESKQNSYEEALNNFQEKLTILPNGRPVIKLESETTKYRPCFDGSACEKGKPSLNHCLYKGVNLLEVIPDVLDRFRLYPIGLSADIEKAFLMLSVAPKDRDYLRFFYPIKEGELVYRHCRIVFGLNSSPFLL